MRNKRCDENAHFNDIHSKIHTHVEYTRAVTICDYLLFAPKIYMIIFILLPLRDAARYPGTFDM